MINQTNVQRGPSTCERTAYLAVDLGAESGRAIVGVLAGGRLECHEVHRFAHQPVRLPSGLHWDITGLWSEVLEGLRRAVAWCDLHRVPLVSIGVDTWGVDFGLLSASGELLGLPHCYRDERHVAAFEQTVAALGRDFLYANTGNQLMPLNTLYQLVARRSVDPQLLDRARKLLFMPDLMHFFLTGRVAVEASIASTSQMLDPRTCGWATALLEKLDIPARLLDPVVAPGTQLGPLVTHVAAQVGGNLTTVVTLPASHDTASAVAAIPADEAARWCYLSSGTWSLLGAELDQPCLSGAARDAPFTNEVGVGGTICFHRNITGLWLIEECRRALARSGQCVEHDALMNAAAAAPPFRTLVDPNHAPFATQGDMPARLADFARSTGQPEPGDSGALIRCCLESLALAYRHALNQLEALLNRQFDIVHVVGGGSRNSLLNQMVADATGRTVVIGPPEATAMGNILTQALGLGAVREPSQIRQIVGDSTTPQVCQPRDTAAWDAGYARFLELLHR